MHCKLQKKRTIVRPPLQEAHADVALVEMKDLVTLTRASKSWIYEAIASGDFPAPAVKLPRMTRWRLADIRAWLTELSSTPAVTASSGDLDNGFGGQGPPHEASGPRAVQVGESAANADVRKVRRLDSEGGR
jgi:predicted DNA-binding transcriptional regulator AlpA